MQTILDVNDRPISPLWAAEFRGFFLGEGNLEIGQYSRIVNGERKKFLRPRARLIQRDDCQEILWNIQKVLGGHVTGHKAQRLVSGGNGKTYTNRPQTVWQTVSADGVQRVLLLLDNGVFPHKKLAEINVVQRYLNLAHSSGHKYTDEQKEELWALKAELENLRKYV